MTTVAEAQAEVREVFLDGSVGQLVSAMLWLASSAVATWGSRKAAIVVLVVGGMFIFPLTQLVLKVSGRRSALSRENPLGPLAMQVAFIVPLTLPVAGGATLHNPNWFYPACAIIVGAHYLPFVFLYGMWQYALLGGMLIAGGLACALLAPQIFATAGWLTTASLALFGAWAAARRSR